MSVAKQKQNPQRSNPKVGSIQFSCTPDGLMLSANPAAVQFVGRTVVPGQTVEEFAGEVVARHCLDSLRLLTPEEPLSLSAIEVADALLNPKSLNTAVLGQFDADGCLTAVQFTASEAPEPKSEGSGPLLERLAYQQILDDQFDLIIRFDPDSSVLFANRACCDFCGVERDELVGRRLSGLNGPFVALAPLSVIPNITSNNRLATVEASAQNAEGSERWLRWLVRGIFGPDNILQGFQATGQDFTAQREAQQLLIQTQNQLEQLVRTRTSELQEVTNKLLLNREMADSLQQTSMALNRALDLPVVLYLILSQLRRVSLHDGAGIWLLEGDELVLSEVIDHAIRYINRRINISTTDEAIVHVIRSGEGMVVEDCVNDPRWVTWPDGAGIRSWIGLPLVIGTEVIGAMSIDRLVPHAYTESDLKALRPFADQAAIAVLNARLLRQARQDAATEERERLARDLHDAVTQTLFSASLLAEAVPLQFQQDPEGAKASLNKLQQLTRGALGEMRTLLLELRPATLVNSNLGTLLGYLGDAATARSRIPVSLNVSGTEIGLPPDVQIVFYRVAQEALNNVTKHAAATQIQINYDSTDEAATLIVADNGRGFATTGATHGPMGLSIMAERAASIGAWLQVNSLPDHGTTVSLGWYRTEAIQASLGA